MQSTTLTRLLAGIVLGLAACGASAEANRQTGCREIAGDYQIARLSTSREFLEYAIEMLGEISDVSAFSRNEDDNLPEPTLRIRQADDAFTVSVLADDAPLADANSKTARVAAENEEDLSGKPQCMLQIESDTDKSSQIWILRRDFRETPDAVFQEWLEHVSIMWGSEVRPEKVRSVQYLLMLTVSMIGVGNFALYVPLEKIGADPVRQD
jgi:hypothetical protein